MDRTFIVFLSRIKVHINVIQTLPVPQRDSYIGFILDIFWGKMIKNNNQISEEKIIS